MKRFLRFTRSVLPTEGIQLALLFGVLCLFIAPDLRWAPWGKIYSPIRPEFQFRVVKFLGLCAIRLSGCLGYFVCFRPGGRPVRRLLCWVLLPAALGTVLMCSFYAHAAATSALVSENSRFSNYVHSPHSVLARLGPGFHYTVLGFVLVASFTSKLAFGSASLPLALPESSVCVLEDSASWNRVEMFVWVLLVLVPTVHWVFPVMNFIYFFVRSHTSSFKDLAGFSVQLFAEYALFTLLALAITGREAWNALRRCIRWPSAEGLALGVAFPVGVAVVISVGQLSIRMLRSIGYRSDSSGLSTIGSYFTLPSIGLLWLLPAALGEEIVFRGVLQPRFIRRYGLVRGILLVGIAFGAAHLSTDFSVGFTDGSVILKMFARLSECLALSFVAGWLTVRTGSVLPAALAHGLMNILGSSPLGPEFFGIGPLTYFLWAGLAWLLFAYWPIRTEAVPEFVVGRS